MKNYRLRDISQGHTEVADTKQGIVRGYVIRNNGLGEHWTAWYPCEPYMDYSGSETTIMFARRYRAGDAKHMAHLIDDIGSSSDGRKTDALLFRTRHDAATFVVANG